MTVPQQQGTKRVSFDVQGRAEPVLAVSSTSALPPPPSVTKISDLCGVLSKTRQSSSWVGYLDDHDLHQHVFVNAERANLDESRDILCFSDVFRRSFPYGLGVKEKFVASSNTRATINDLVS